MILKGGVGKLLPPMHLDNFIGGPFSPGGVNEFLGKILWKVYTVSCMVRSILQSQTFGCVLDGSHSGLGRRLKLGS